MKAIFLCAGFATRMYPLTEYFPKPLLPYEGTAVLGRLVLDVAQIPGVDGGVIVSNKRFAEVYRAWAKKQALPLIVLDDGAEDNDHRLGAVRDLAFALQHIDTSDGALVMAGDNALTFSLSGFVAFYREKDASCAMVYDEPLLENRRRTGVAELSGDRIIRLHEKPVNPPTSLCVPPFYVYNERALSLVAEALHEGCPADAPGQLLSWMVSREKVCAYPMPGGRVDISDAWKGDSSRVFGG